MHNGFLVSASSRPLVCFVPYCSTSLSAGLASLEAFASFKTPLAETSLHQSMQSDSPHDVRKCYLRCLSACLSAYLPSLVFCSAWQMNNSCTSMLLLLWNAGLFYWFDIFMRFRMGFCVIYNLKRELIMDGGLIAHFYVRHNTFVVDVLAAIPAIAEVHLSNVVTPLCSSTVLQKLTSQMSCTTHTFICLLAHTEAAYP